MKWLSKAYIHCNAKSVEGWDYHKFNTRETTVRKPLRNIESYFSNVKAHNKGKTLEIKSAVKENEGVYICVGMNNVEDGFFYAATTITVKGKITIY